MALALANTSETLRIGLMQNVRVNQSTNNMTGSAKCVPYIGRLWATVPGTGTLRK